MTDNPIGPEPETEWQKSLVPADATLGQAIRVLDEGALQITLVVSSDGTLLGTVTDGDVRRGLLRGLDLDDPIDEIIQREPLVVPDDLPRAAVLRLMHVNLLRQVPIVDGERRVVGLHVWDSVMVPAERPNLMVIMAGGQGTRMRPDTEHCPKPLLPVGGKPILEHIIERAKAQGFRHFVLAVHYLGHMIESHFGDGSRWQVSIDYLREEDPLGTAGAIGLLEPRPKHPLLISNGDVLTDIGYGEMIDFHCHHNAAATMAVRRHEWQHPFGVVLTEGVHIVGFEEKPVVRHHINAGIYVLEATALDALEAGQHCDMPTLFSRLRDRARSTIIYPMHEPWLDVGNKDDLGRAGSLF